MSGALLCVVSLTSAQALGDASSADRALATDLFQRGRRALLAGDYAQACPLLEESQRLDPAGGTLLNVALCHEKLGRTATAWSEFLEALSIARRERREDRVRYATEHVALLEARLSRLTIEIPREVLVPNLRVERDGSVLGPSTWGAAMPVDPGPHTVRVSAPGYHTFEREVVMGEADTQRITVTKLEPVAPEPAPPAAAPAPMPPAVEPAVQPSAPAQDASAREAVPASQRSRRNQRLRAASLSLLVFAVLSAASATGAGVKAIKLRKDAESHCRDGRCEAEAFELNTTARRCADASTVLSVASAASLAGGLWLWWSREPEAAGRNASFGVGVRRVF